MQCVGCALRKRGTEKLCAPQTFRTLSLHSCESLTRLRLVLVSCTGVPSKPHVLTHTETAGDIETLQLRSRRGSALSGFQRLFRSRKTDSVFKVFDRFAVLR